MSSERSLGLDQNKLKDDTMWLNVDGVSRVRLVSACIFNHPTPVSHLNVLTRSGATAELEQLEIGHEDKHFLLRFSIILPEESCGKHEFQFSKGSFFFICRECLFMYTFCGHTTHVQEF